MEKIKKAGLLFSGGPAPSANSVISSVALNFINAGIEVIGFLRGLEYLEKYGCSLIEGEHYLKINRTISHIRNERGVFLKTSRANPGKDIREEKDLEDEKRSRNLRNIADCLKEFDIDLLITIGGDDTLKTANYLSIIGVRVIHVPKTIDTGQECPAGRRRHFPRRRPRAAGNLGPAQQRDGHRPGQWRSGGSRLRRHFSGQGARHRHRAGRHGWPPANPVAPDGRNRQGAARHPEDRAGRPARNTARTRRQYRPERAAAGQGLRQGDQRHRPGVDQARRHRARWRRHGYRPPVPEADPLHRRRRADRRSATVFGQGFCRRAVRMIVASNLCKRYPGGYEAVKDVSFVIEAGQMLLITGHSGAGKSTLVKLIASIEVPT